MHVNIIQYENNMWQYLLLDCKTRKNILTQYKNFFKWEKNYIVHIIAFQNKLLLRNIAIKMIIIFLFLK